MAVVTSETLVSLAQALAVMRDSEARGIARALREPYGLSWPAVALHRWRARCLEIGLGTYSVADLRAAIAVVGSLDAIRAAYRPVAMGKDWREVERLERATGIPTPRGSQRAGTGPIGDKGSTAPPGRKDSPGETTPPGRNSYPGRKDSPGGDSASVGQDTAVKRKRRRRRR